MKITSADALEGIRRSAAEALAVREEGDRTVAAEACGLDKGTPHLQVLCCGGTGCKASESEKIVENFRQSLREHAIAD